MIQSPSTPVSSPRSSIFIAAALAIAMLYFGRRIFIPLSLALVLSFLLAPLVALFEKLRWGRFPSVIAVVALCIALAGAVGWGVGSQLLEIMAHIGDYKANLQQKVHALRAPKNGPIEKATATVRELNKELSNPERVTGGSAQPSGEQSPGQSQHPVAVRVIAPPSTLMQDVTSLLGPLAGPIETAGIVIVFTAFTLVKREDLRNRLIRLGGEGRLHVMTQALDDASRALSRYLWLQFVVNVGYGTLFGLGLYVIGVPHAFLWGAIEALLRFAPYVGTLLGASFPTALALAVFPGWRHAALVFGLFFVLEIAVANAIEPWLYGANTGISSFAILVAAIFWTMLWGLPGLILSTPVTLCLMLAGRYIPRLDFLQVLLGDEPVLKPEEHFYQRLLAMDADEARSIAEESLKENSLQSVYESVLVPALSLAEQDRHMKAIDDRVSEFLLQNVRELIEDLGQQAERLGVQPEPSEAGGDNRKEEFAEARMHKPRIACIPAHDDADELVAIMLSQLLWMSGSNAVHLPPTTMHETVEQISRGDFRMVCVSALPPFAVGQARLLCRRLRAKFPNLQIVVGLWGFSGGAGKAQERIGSGNNDAVVISLEEAVSHLRRLAQELLFKTTTPMPGEDRKLA